MVLKSKEGEQPLQVYKSFEHKSQHFVATWNEPNEPIDTIAQKPKTAFKFGVLKVSNLHKDLWHGRFHGGIATGLKADITLMCTSHKVLDGRLIPEPEDQRAWSSPLPLMWYDEGWNMSLRSEDVPQGIEEKQAKTIEELKKVADNPLFFLRHYFRREMLDTLPQGRSAYLLLFCTCVNLAHSFFPTFGNSGSLLGEYKFKISIFSNEISVEDLIYDFRITDWNDFSITASKKEDQKVKQTITVI